MGRMPTPPPTADRSGRTGHPSPASTSPSDQVLERVSPRASVTLDRIGARSVGVRIVVIAVVGYVVATAVAVVLGVGAVALNPLDSQIMAWVVERRGWVATDVTSFVSNLSDTWTVIGAAFGAVTILLLVGLGRQATLVAIGLGVEVSVFVSTTYVVDRPRPAVP